MSQKITDFYTRVHNKDFARLFQFRLQQFPGLGADENHLIMVETLSLPSRSITNIPVPFMGLQFNVPGTATYPGSDAWNVTFRCDSEYTMRTLIENQTIRTFDDSRSAGDYTIPAPRGAMVLNLMDANFNISRQYKFIGPYITNVGDISYDIGDGGNIVKCNVTLAYQYWRVSKGSGRNSSTAFYSET